MSSAPEEANSLRSTASSFATQDKPIPSNIQIYLRMRPMVGRCEWHSVAGKDGRTFVTKIPREDGIALNNARAEYKFRFDGIFNQEATQEEVFEGAALPVVDDALRGINGTVFAYGQTGTGKTYTITGGAEAFEMRGIIPRALARVFEFASSCASAEFTLAISYLEIYQDRGYDLLLKTEKGGKSLEDLKRVYAVADDTDQVFLRGLSVNPVRTEEEALNLLFVGDANRIVAETPLNDCSTRSHCIFTIWIASKDHGSSSIRRAKLHLVDLAGSERVKQSGTRPGDCIFQEACSINLTLHYLEQVIMALQQRAAGQATHVPYRNSLMTSVLKDSLGGNCKTRMIATIALELYAIQETINTCRFAQAVAQVKNIAAVNEEEEAAALIERLQKENERLRGQLQLATAANEEQVELTEEGKESCRDSVERFLRASGDDLKLPVAAARDLRSADFCFRVMRDKFNEAAAKAAGPCTRRDCRQSLQKLQLHVEQRDAEIATLLGFLHQNAEPGACTQNADFDPLGAMTRAAVEAIVRGPQHESTTSGSDQPWLTGPEATTLLMDRGRAFEILRRSARKAEFLEADSQRLRRLYVDAKKYGEAAVSARNKIAEARANLEKIRIRKCMKTGEGPHMPDDDTPEETRLLDQVAGWRDEYIKNIDALGAAKRELKRVHLSVERGRKKLQEDFESWFNVVAARHMQRLDQPLENSPHLPGKPPGTPNKIAQLPTLEHQVHSMDTPDLGAFARFTPRQITPWVTPRGGYPWVTDSIPNQGCMAPVALKPRGGSPSSQCSEEQQASTGAPLVMRPTLEQSTVANAPCLDVPKQRSCAEEPQNGMEGATPDLRSPRNPGTSWSGRNCLNSNGESSAPSAVNTGLVPHPRSRIPQQFYTGNPAADADIKAFYEVMGPNSQVPCET